jgi:precorrin-6B methylase 2
MKHAAGTGESTRLAPFNPTCAHAQEVALRLLSLKEGDVLFDLGCGDARFLIAAAKHTPGLQCIGMEIDPVYTKRANEALSLAPLGVRKRVEIREGDVLRLINKNDTASAPSLMNDATAVFVYLLPKGLKAIRPILQATAEKRYQEGKAFRVISYMFSMPPWEPASEVDRTTKGECPVYLYTLDTILTATL